MGVSQNIVVEKVGVDPNQTLRIERSTHVVDVGFTCAFQPRIVASTEGVKNPCQLIFCARINMAKWFLTIPLAWIFLKKSRESLLLLPFHLVVVRGIYSCGIR
jgi:hypothetical protein